MVSPPMRSCGSPLSGSAAWGGSHVGDSHVKAEQVVALTDIDDHAIENAAKIHPKARKFNDFREMFDKMAGEIDAVICATPDHTHAVVTSAALRLGKHAYTQKPLTHTVYEANVLSRLARDNPKLATQMGNQGHSNEGARRVVEVVRAGAVGPIREVHAWTDRPIWPQGIDRPEGTPPVPKNIHWDLFLGPMPERPYNPAYIPFRWRGVVGLRHGGARGHGLPRRRYRLLGARPATPDVDRRRVQGDHVRERAQVERHHL